MKPADEFGLLRLANQILDDVAGGGIAPRIAPILQPGALHRGERNVHRLSHVHNLPAGEKLSIFVNRHSCALLTLRFVQPKGAGVSESPNCLTRETR